MPATGAPTPTASSHAAVDEADLVTLLGDAARATGVIGAALAVFDGERTHVVTTGQSNETLDRPVTPATLFQIGSATKVYNAALVMQLVDEGRVDLGEPVSRYLPELQLPDADARDRVTLRQLLSMTSGLDNGPYSDHGPGDDAVARYVEGLADVPLVAAPGQMFGYSNAGTIVAGRVVERITGLPWRRALADRLLGPAGLSDSLTEFEDLVYRDVAIGYAPGEEGPVPVRPWRLPTSMAPAGSTLSTTAADALAFCRLFLDRGRSTNGAQLLSDEAVRTMQGPVVELPADLQGHSDAWCIGPNQRRFDGATLYGHAGVNRSGSSKLLWCPERNVAVVTLVNVPAVAHRFNQIVIGSVLAELFGIHLPPPPVPDDTVRPQVERLVGIYRGYGGIQEVTAVDGRLSLRFTADPALPSIPLVAVTATSFVPADPAQHTVVGWPLVFIGTERGPATHVINGIFAARRLE